MAAYHFLRDVGKDEEILGDYGEGWRSVMEWTKCSVKNADGKSCIEIEKARIERSRAAGRRLLIDKLK